ncbi:helix-turn-helix domain-containing protein [Paenibacillus rhizoplanae]
MSSTPRPGSPRSSISCGSKIQRAGHLLDLTELSIKEVGAAVGINDPYYFSRLFKRISGFSPSSYRRIPKG